MSDREPDNEIRVCGWLAFDPEWKGKTVHMRLPVKSWRKDPEKPDDPKARLTNWFKVVAFGDWAQKASEFRKGDRIRVIGTMELQKWKDRDTGALREGFELQVGRDGLIEAAPLGQAQPSRPQRQGSQAPSAPPQSASLPLPTGDAELDPNWDDTVPF